MKDKYFLDTNILIYSFDQTQYNKRTIAQKLIAEGLSDHRGCISSQVIQEFLNVALRKFAHPFSTVDAQSYLNMVLSPLCEVYMSTSLYLQTLEIVEHWKFSFYDSLIISAALTAHCSILYSEDLQHRQKIHNMMILNPFIS